MTKKTKLIFYLNVWLPPLLWAGLIFFLSAQSLLPKFEASMLEFMSKKLAHLFVYAILYLLFYRAVRLQFKPSSQSKLQVVLPLILCLIYAISDELHQAFVPGRYATIRDIGFDMLGVGTAFFWKYGYI